MQDTDMLRSLADRLTEPSKMTYETPLLNEREKTHGSFEENARVMQELKQVARGMPGWNRLKDTHREALDMIFHKIGRVINGDPNFKDHWKDISGYAKLCEERCNGQSE